MGYIEDNIISEIVCRYVNEQANELAQIGDFFQFCPGRTILLKSEGNSDSWLLRIEGKEFQVFGDSVFINGIKYRFDKEERTIKINSLKYSYSWVKKQSNVLLQRKEKPLGKKFCDGVKIQYDKENEHSFFWCNGRKCYSPNQNDHIHLEWSSYSLRDFIKILNLTFDEDKYYRFIGLLNRVNSLIEKLKCNSCSKLLRDAKSSELAFYRVTTFHCTNIECIEYQKPVYLNHCMNRKCGNIVDSRISITCPNGWFICDICNNCCSNEKLQNRLDTLINNGKFNPNNQRHQKLKFQVDNSLGHRERNEIYDHISGKMKNI